MAQITLYNLLVLSSKVDKRISFLGFNQAKPDQAPRAKVLQELSCSSPILVVNCINHISRAIYVYQSPFQSWISDFAIKLKMHNFDKWSKIRKLWFLGSFLKSEIYWILLKVIFQNKTGKIFFIGLVALLYSNFGKRCEE